MAGTDIPLQESDADLYKDLQPALGLLESVRRKCSYIFAACLLLGIFVGLPALYHLFHHLELTIPPAAANRTARIIGPPAGCFGVMLIFIYWPVMTYQRIYKNTVIPKIVRSAGLDHYDESGVISLDEARAACIFPPYDRYDAKDYFEGIRKGARISFCKLTLVHEENNSFKRTFEGIALLIKIPQNKFSGNTVLIKRKNRSYGWLVDTFPEGLQRVHLEDPAFEREYQVYANDQIEARCILDPVMMERIEAISNMYFSKEVTVSYYGGNRVLALIPSGGRFFNPPGIWRPATDIHSVARLKREVQSMIALVDHLDSYRPSAKTEEKTA